MKSVKYLDEVAKKHGLTNDSALARHLNIRPNAISQYRSGKRVMDEETCLAVALALEIDPARILMAAGIDRAEKTGQKSLWEVFSQRMATAASVILMMMAALVVNLFLTVEKAEAAPLLASSQIQQAEHFILCQIKRFSTAMLAAFKRWFSGGALQPAAL